MTAECKELLEAIAAIVTIIGFIILIFTIIIALRQFKEMIKSRHLEALIKVYELIGSESARMDRFYIFNKLNPAPDKISMDGWLYIQRVSTTFDKIGMLVKAGLIPQKELFESHYETIVRSWIKLEPYIEYYRDNIGGRHVHNFQELARKAKIYHTNNFPEEDLSPVNINEITLGSSNRSTCAIVRQLPNHCVPACLESIAKDYGINITQTEIVASYPDVFPNGVLEDAGKSRTLNTVVKDFGLAEGVYNVNYNLQDLKDLQIENEILLFWTKISNHCVRFCGFNEDSSQITIMDPECDELQTHDVCWLEEICPKIIYFKKPEKK